MQHLVNTNLEKERTITVNYIYKELTECLFSIVLSLYPWLQKSTWIVEVLLLVWFNTVVLVLGRVDVLVCNDDMGNVDVLLCTVDVLLCINVLPTGLYRLCTDDPKKIIIEKIKKRDSLQMRWNRSTTFVWKVKIWC